MRRWEGGRERERKHYLSIGSKCQCNNSRALFNFPIGSAQLSLYLEGSNIVRDTTRNFHNLEGDKIVQNYHLKRVIDAKWIRDCIESFSIR